MTYRKLSVRLFDDATDAFSRVIPPSWKNPLVPVVDIIPALPSTTDQGDRERELRKKLKPIQYKSMDSPDRGLAYNEVYPASRGGPVETQGETVGQVFRTLNSRDEEDL
jgi:hypothetical protein